MCIYDHGFCSQKSCGEMRISMTRISVRLLFQVISCWNNGWRELSFSLSLSEMKEMAIKLLQMIKCANGSRCMAKFDSCIFSGPMTCKRGRVKVKNAIKIVRACCIWSERKSPNATASMCASSWVMILINWCIARVACVCVLALAILSTQAHRNSFLLLRIHFGANITCFHPAGDHTWSVARALQIIYKLYYLHPKIYHISIGQHALAV